MRKKLLWWIGPAAALAIGVAGSISEAGSPGELRDGVRSFACPSEGSLADEMANFGGVRGSGDCQSFGEC